MRFQRGERVSILLLDQFGRYGAVTMPEYWGCDLFDGMSKNAPFCEKIDS